MPRWYAATMVSSAVPVVDHGGSKFVLIISMTLLAGVALVVWRKRYSGISLGAGMPS